MLNMQRQSLGGSPGSKLGVHGGAKEEKLLEDEHKRKDGGGVTKDEEEESKVEKLHHRSAFRVERSIHLIPILTISCILVLYLCSHDPTQKDLIQFNGLKSSSVKIDSALVSDFEKLMEIDKGDVLAIRGHRSLQEVENHERKSRFHRKIGGF